VKVSAPWGYLISEYMDTADKTWLKGERCEIQNTDIPGTKCYRKTLGIVQYV
jgi:hypothetical protein